MVLPARYKLLNCPKISLNGAHLSGDNDITRQMRCFYIRGNFLARSFAHCSDAVKVKLFKAFCTNMYCCHLNGLTLKSAHLISYVLHIIIVLESF